ncbi:MAG: hypothetical protein AAFU50_07805, partial [Pseudomonadota bacterium]
MGLAGGMKPIPPLEARTSSGDTDGLPLGGAAAAAAAANAAPRAFADGPSPDELKAGRPERRRARRRPAGPSRERIAANDEAPSIGGLIYALNQKPSNRPFYIATIASGVWLVAGLVFGYLTLAPQIASQPSLVELIRNSGVMTTLAGIFGPPLLFWFLAFLTWRSDEMHLRSTAMTEVAVRLAEPDRLAEQQVTALGQAVSRQIGFMNEAVGQAMNRASELEAIVKSEVVALEQSYEENEKRIRGLLQELASERNSLTGTGENFRDTLSTLAQDVPALIERLSEQQQKLSGIITGAGTNLTQLENSLASETGRLETTLGSRAQELQTVLETYTGAIGETLETQSEQVKALLDDRTNSLGIQLQAHSYSVETTLTGYTEALGTVLEGRSNDLTRLLDESGTHFRTMLSDHSETVEQDLERRMTSIEDGLSRKTEALQAVFEEYTHAIDTSMDERTRTLDARMIERTNALDTSMIERTKALDTSMIERTKALDAAFDERLRLFDEAMLRSTSAIEGAIGSNASALTSALEQHAL